MIHALSNESTSSDLLEMTINRSDNIGNQYYHHQNIDIIENNENNSEFKRIEYLALIRESLKKNNGLLNCNDTTKLIDVLSQAFSDDDVSTRKIALDLLYEAIPLYGTQLDTDVGILFPQLIQNLLNNHEIVCKGSLQVLACYYQHCLNKDVALNYLIHYGINSESKALKNEVLVSIPTIIKSGFHCSTIQTLFLAIIDNCSDDTVTINESNLPTVICLKHLKTEMGEEEFKTFFDTLDLDIITKYLRIMDNVRENNITIKGHKDDDDDLAFGFLPMHVIENLWLDKSYQTRSDTIVEFSRIVTSLEASNKMVLSSRDLFDYIHNLVEDVNFNVALTSLHILHQTIVTLGQETKIHLDVIMKILLKKLNDSKIVIRKINLCIGLSLMHVLTPSVFLQVILPLLKHKSARIREEVLNIITGALLSFSSHQFNLQTLPQLIGFTLLDIRKRVRHGSLECFVMVAHLLGPGKLSPLVSAVDVLERKNKYADGLLLAVQTRLGRRLLPKINNEGLVQYSLRLPTNIIDKNKLAPDVAWIIAGSSSGCETNRSGSDQDSKESLTDRRLFSAGKNKLPWHLENETMKEKKTVSSAPIRSSISPIALSKVEHSGGHSPVEFAAVADVWGSEKRLTSGHNISNEKAKNDENTYFLLYKNKMRKMKEAGLKADNNLMKSHVYKNEKSYCQYNSHHAATNGENFKRNSPRGFENSHGMKVISPDYAGPVPMKPTLARSASKKRLEKMFNNEEFGDSNLAHTLPKMRGGLIHVLSSSNEFDSPFSSRPALHRSPSGSLKHCTIKSPSEETNLVQMKKFSNSSPAVIDKNFDQIFPLSPLHWPEITGQNFTVEQSSRHISKSISPLEKKYDYSHLNGYKDNSEYENGASHSIGPKLSKSAQEKLRKHEELRNYQDSENCYDADGGHYNDLYKNNSAIIQSNTNLKYNGRNNKDGSHERIDLDFTSNRLKDGEHRLNEVDKIDSAATKNYKEISLPTNGIMMNHRDKKQSGNFYEEKSDGYSNIVHSPRKTDNSAKGRASNHVDHNNNNNNSNDVDLKKNNDMSDDTPKARKSPGNVPPKATSSPKLKRKQSRNIVKPMVDDGNECPVALPPKTFSSDDLEVRLERPLETMTVALEMLRQNAEEWETKCEALILLRRLLRHHAEVIVDIHAVVMALLAEVKNLRSQVTRSALSGIGEVFVYTPRTVEQELEVILKTVLPKAGDTNQFIRADTESSVNRLVENVNPTKAMAAIVATGAEHRNGSVRNLCAKALAELSEKVGAVRFCQVKNNITVAGKLAVDSQPQARYNGRRMLYLILQQPDLDQLLEKHVKSTNLRPVRDVVETLKNKGLEAPTGSATMRRSTRNGSSVAAASPATTRRSSRRSDTSERSARSSSTNSRKATSGNSTKRNTTGSKEDLSFLEMLNSNNWSDRYEGLDYLYDAVSQNLVVSSHLAKVFDNFVPRLNDSNSKVNLYALQTLNRCIPVLENSLTMVAPLLVESLKPALSSKNDAIYNAARQCLTTLTKHVDNMSLIPAIASAIQHGNMRNKPDYMMSLADVIPHVYAKKPSAIQRQIVPLLFDLLSTSASGVTISGRCTFQQAICQLTIRIYECMGEELISEANKKQARVSQRLGVILNLES